MFVTDAATLQAINDTLQGIGAAPAPSYLANINVRAHQWAYNVITMVLTRRGWLLAQIVQWDNGPAAEVDLTVFRALSQAGTLVDVPNDLLKSLDWRPELKTVELTIAGVYQDPLGQAGQVTGGQISGLEVGGLHDDGREETSRGEHVGPGSIWG
jgi:hypothetical protein